MIMKKIALILLCSIILIGGASAYIITLSAPKIVYAGETLTVNGTSNLPPGFSSTVGLSKVKASGYVAEKQFTVQADGSFSLSFDTSSLEEGTYRLEVFESNEYTYGTSSITWLSVQLIDRRNELIVTSPLSQSFDGTLDVAGSISTVEDQGLKIQVQHGAKIVFGPEYISTNDNGAFDVQVPIDSGGTYDVTLTDSTDYPWSIQYTVQTPAPTPTVTTTTETPMTTVIPMTRQATTTASRTQPAYFEVATYPGEVHAFTSSGVDWVVEYINEAGVLNKINTRGTAAEEVRFAANGGTVYFKIYPDQFADQASITLSVENARSVSLCTTCQALFGDVITTPATPLTLFLALGALVVLVIARRRS
jgi:hypothetical protein